jgi:hypothetical protein
MTGYESTDIIFQRQELAGIHVKRKTLLLLIQGDSVATKFPDPASHRFSQAVKVDAARSAQGDESRKIGAST